MFDSGTEYCIRRAPDCHSNDQGFSSNYDKPRSTFLVVGRGVGERLF